jgi:peroxiredoxin
MNLFLYLTMAFALENGKKAPDFQLTSMDGQKYRLSSFVGKVVVLEWFNPGCPFVKYTYENKLTTTVAEKNPDVVWLAINSSAANKQGHGVKINKQAKKEWGINFPILFDENGMTGKAYDAKTTPHMYIINQAGVLVYQGALDDSPLGRGSKRIPYIENALDSLKKGNPISVPKSKAYGCSVKYK